MVALVSPGALAQSRPALSDETAAVVQVAACDTPGAVPIPRIFRNTLKAAGMSVLSEADTAAPLGGLSVRSAVELTQALADARDEFLDGQVILALQSLKALSDEVAKLAPSPERWELQRNVLANLAQVRGRSDKAAARTALLQILSVDPEYKADSSIFPPSFIAEVETVRAELKRTPANELQVTTEPTETGIVVGGRPMGPAPMTLSLPAGFYRLEGMWGYRGLTKVVEVEAPPGSPVNVVLSKAREGSISPDGGPCLVPIPTREAALARFAAFLKVRWVYAIRSETAGKSQRLVAEQFDAAAGHQVREHREAVVPPDSGSQAAARLALSFASPAGAQAISKASAPVINTGLRTWSYVAGGVGLAAATAGIVFYFIGNSKIQKLYSQYAEGNNVFPPNYESTFQSQSESAKASKTAGVVLAGVGVAALATGVALFLVSGRGGQAETVVAVGPYLPLGGGGAAVSGRF